MLMQVKSKLKGHTKRISGLAFSNALNVLVSSGADAQVIYNHSKSLHVSRLLTQLVASIFSSCMIYIHSKSLHVLHRSFKNIGMFYI